MNYIDLSCPAELFRTAMPTEEIPAATLTLFNLSDRVIVSVEVLLRLLDEDGGETERLAYRGRALNGRPHSTFLLTAPCAPSEELHSIDVVIEKVWFADNEVWRREPGKSIAYISNALPISPALTKLKYAAGETAVGYPVEQEGLWLCVCGRPNPEDAEFCARCSRQKEMIFSRFSPEAVEAQVNMRERQLDLNSRSMREDTIRLQRIREEEYQQKKSRRGTRIRILIAMAASVALCAGAFFGLSPWLRLLSGREALAAGNPAGAKETFLLLGDYGNAKEMITECDWQIALETADSGNDAETLAKASALLRAIPGKPEAIDKANETDLLRARMLLEQGDWQGAQEALLLLPEDYEGKSELEQKAGMAQATALKAEEKYEEARTIFLSLGDYPGAREQASDCLYEPAQKKMEQADWDGAIDMLSGIPDYLNSREMTLECHYHKAEDLLAAGDRDGASREFLLAGDWSDAKERCKALTYEQADEYYAAGDIKTAQSLFASIPDYMDSNDRDRDCRYTLASAAAESREFTLALELLQNIPDDYKKTGSIRAQATYEKAKAATRREEWTEAAELLASLDRQALRRQYRDIENLYLQACEKAGINPYPETPAPPETDGAAETPEAAPETTPAPAEPEQPAAEPTDTPAPDPFLVTEDEQQ